MRRQGAGRKPSYKKERRYGESTEQMRVWQGAGFSMWEWIKWEEQMDRAKSCSIVAWNGA
jgi:hypothetical protein